MPQSYEAPRIGTAESLNTMVQTDWLAGQASDTTSGQSLMVDGNYVVQWSQQSDYRHWQATQVVSGITEETRRAYEDSLRAQQANRTQYLEAALGAPAQRPVWQSLPDHLTRDTVHYGRGGRGPEIYTDCEPEDL